VSIDPEELDLEEIFGSGIERREDPALLTGETRYTDDIQRADAVHMAVVRSQHAHARLEEINTSAAEAMNGVVGAFTAADLSASDAPGELPTRWLLPDLKTPQYPILAEDRVRFDSAPVAVVLAEGRYLAHEARRAVKVEYDRLEAVTDPREAVDSEASTVHEGVPDNRAFEWETGDADATEAAFEDADRTVELDLENQRLMPVPMEPRVAVAEYSPNERGLSVTMASQNPHFHRTMLNEALGVPEHRLHVEAPDVGGGFGGKTPLYPGEALTAWCAMQIERPAKWQATRSKGLKADAHARDHRTTATLAFDDDGSIRGLDVDTTANLGAYLSTFGAVIPSIIYTSTLSGPYEIPAIRCSVTGAFTNTAPVDAYRGAGKPESAYLFERLVHLAARDLDLDPAEFRRKNLISPEDFPYESPTGSVYDSGDYVTAQHRALDLADYEEVRARQTRRRQDANGGDGSTGDRFLGVGIASYVEPAGLGPSDLMGMAGARDGFYESGLVRMQPRGR